MIRRLLPTATIVAVLSMALAGSAVAGGGGGGFGALGRTTQTQRSGFAFLQDPSGNVLVNSEAQGGILTFKAKGTAGPPTSTPGTLVQISVGGNIPSAGAFDCWVIPDSMFTVNSDLSASLHFRSDAAGVALCPGFALASGLPASGLAPLGGEGFGFIGPVALDLVWPTSSQLFHSRSTDNASCGPFLANSMGTLTDNFGTSASGNISATIQGVDNFGNLVPLPINVTLTSQFADVSTFATDTVVNGPTTGSCGPFVGS